MKACTKKKVTWLITGLLLAVLLFLLNYFIYLFTTYKRIPDKVELQVLQGTNRDELQTGEDITYSVLTYNVGFGAYVPEYSFFMDGGKYSRAFSKEAALQAIEGSASVVKQLQPDFVLLQELDLRATRSYDTNQYEIVSSYLPSYTSSYAVNFDSAYLLYPFHEPHGKSISCIALYSAHPVTSAIRRSLPIETDFSKFFDLDRCYSVAEIPANGKNLVVYNVHLSAYSSDENMRNAQMELLFQDMEEQYKKGNYVICGGDFNRDLKADWTKGLDANKDTWAQPFDRTMLPDGFVMGLDQLSSDIVQSMPDTNRSAETPYEPGITTTYTLDGFIYSDNVTMLSYETIDLQYEYSDHNPVYMTFTLLP